ncbi:MAG: diguanylate cyclase [Trueperaceae bacterium]
MDTEQHVDPTLLALVGETVQALRDARYEDAITLGRQALDEFGLDPAAEVESNAAQLERLPPAALKGAGDVLTSLAISSFRSGDYVSALRYSQFEHQLRRQAGDELGAAQALVGLGWCYQTLGLYQQALPSSFSALEMLEQLRPEAIAGPLNVIGRVYLDLGQSRKALEYARRGLEASGVSPQKQRDRSTALRIIGQAHHAQGDLAEAERAYLECDETSDDYGRSLAILSLAELYVEQNRFDEALERYQQCVDVLSPQMRDMVLCEALVGLGKVYLARGDVERALGPLTEAISQGVSSGAPQVAAKAHATMAQALKELNRHKEALAHFEAFHELNERTLRQLSDQRTQILTVQLEVERLERDREIDRLHNVELARAYAELAELHQKLEQQAARLERLSRTDELTGLPNRRSFDERLEIELQRAHRTNTLVSVMMVDLDDFKMINDTYSHVVGDAVLRTTGQALSDCMREIDLCARIGGEEFVVLLPETDTDGALVVGQKVIRRVTELNRELRGVNVTASVGVATLEPTDDEESLVARADANLYQAKRAGKNRAQA